LISKKTDQSDIYRSIMINATAAPSPPRAQPVAVALPNGFPAGLLSLSDSQLSAIMAAAHPLQPAARAGFLEAVAARLAGEPEPGDGTVARAARELQRQFFEPAGFPVRASVITLTVPLLSACGPIIMQNPATGQINECSSTNMCGQKLLAGAFGFLAAAEATHERHLREPAEPEHWPAISVNLCFALELSLKAFIALHGAKEKELRAIGHNLIAGLDAAVAAGYSPKHPAVPGLIAMLSPLHVGHSLRYLKDKSADLPDTRNMIAIVRCHVREVGSQIQIADLGRSAIRVP
jgi:hypothetical protein